MQKIRPSDMDKEVLLVEEKEDSIKLETESTNTISTYGQNEIVTLLLKEKGWQTLNRKQKRKNNIKGKEYPTQVMLNFPEVVNLVIKQDDINRGKYVMMGTIIKTIKMTNLASLLMLRQ